MPTITKITPQKRRTGRFNIYLDGKYSFPVSEEVLADFGLKTGLNLTDEEIDKIVNEENFQKYYTKTLDFIAYRVRSKGETVQRLREYLYKSDLDKQFSQQLEERIISKLEEANFLNDEEFVKNYIESVSHSTNPPGSRKIRDFLFKKGVDQGLIDKHLEKYSQESEEGAVQKALEKKLKTVKGRGFKEKQKVMQFLLRKGYSLDLVRSAVDKEFEV